MNALWATIVLGEWLESLKARMWTEETFQLVRDGIDAESVGGRPF